MGKKLFTHGLIIGVYEIWRIKDMCVCVCMGSFTQIISVPALKLADTLIKLLPFVPRTPIQLKKVSPLGHHRDLP